MCITDTANIWVTNALFALKLLVCKGLLQSSVCLIQVMYVSELQSDHEFNCQLKEEIENKINEGRFRCLTQRSAISQLYHGSLQ
jgi:hypothetical protein